MATGEFSLSLVPLWFKDRDSVMKEPTGACSTEHRLNVSLFNRRGEPNQELLQQHIDV